MAIKKDLDPDSVLKIELMLMSFSPEVSFFEETIFFDANVFSVSNERCTGNSQDEEFLKKMCVFLDRKFLLFRRIVLKKKGR